jgi:hypothetical protein
MTLFKNVRALSTVILICRVKNNIENNIKNKTIAFSHAVVEVPKNGAYICNVTDDQGCQMVIFKPKTRIWVYFWNI